MRILNPAAFYLLGFLPLFALVSIWRIRRAWAAYCSLGGGAQNKPAFLLRAALKSAALTLFFLFLILAYADISFGSRLVRKENSGLDLIFVLDVSNSMLADDILPSRIGKAKELAQELVFSLPQARVGAALFKGQAVPAVPLTHDYTALAAFLRAASPALLTAPGSNMADGIDAALRLFTLDSERKKVVVLLSDGESLNGDLNKALRHAAEASVAIYVIGLGTKEGAPLKDARGDFLKTRFGQTVRSRLEEGPLMTVARLTGGRYIAGDDASMGILAAEFKDFEQEAYRLDFEPISLYNFFTFMALLFMFAWMAVRGRRWKKLFGNY